MKIKTMYVITCEWVPQKDLAGLKFCHHLCFGHLAVLRRSGAARFLQSLERCKALGTLPDAQPGESFVEPF